MPVAKLAADPKKTDNRMIERNLIVFMLFVFLKFHV
jgi:hypothetical protein